MREIVASQDHHQHRQGWCPSSSPSYARQDQELISQELRVRVGNAYPTRRKRWYAEGVRGCCRSGVIVGSRFAVPFPFPGSTHVLCSCSYYVLRSICYFLLPVTAAVPSPGCPKYRAHGAPFVVPLLVMISSGACCKRCTAPMIVWTNNNCNGAA